MKSTTVGIFIPWKLGLFFVVVFESWFTSTSLLTLYFTVIAILYVLFPKISYLGVQVERGSSECFLLFLSPSACIITFIYSFIHNH